MFNFDSKQQNVQSFFRLTGTMHHVIVSGDLLVYNPFGAEIKHAEKTDR